MRSCGNGLAKNKTGNHTGYLAGFLFLLIVMISGQKACAAVTEGEPGKTYSGEYVVIVNAGEEAAEISYASGKESVNSNVVSYEEGGQRSFYTYSGPKMFTCIGSSTHCYIWMENELKTAYDVAGKTQKIATDMAETYEQGAWEVLNELGNGQIAYRDGSGKLSIALEQISGATGVYMGKQNEPDITAIHINTPDAKDYSAGEMRKTNGLLVHEGQHALFEQFTEYNPYGKYMGITEGLSVAAMEYAWGNSDSSNWLGYIAGNNAIKNGTSLLYQRYRDQSAQDYGLPYLFIRYLINRKSGTYDPVTFFHSAYRVKASGSAGSYLAAVMENDVSFGDLVTDFYTAIAANEASGVYGFYGDAVVQNALRNYPFYEGNEIESVSLEPTAGIIVPLKEGETFTVPSDKDRNIRYRIVGERNTSLMPAQGSGTAEDPYQITTVREWNLMANHPGAYYELQTNLNLSGSTPTIISLYSGKLDGNGYTIQGLKQPVCVVNKGSIQNLKVEVSARGVGQNDYGMIAKQNEGLISNCVISGSIDLMLSGESSYVGTAFGAVTGRNEVAGKVQNCTVTASIHLSAPAMLSRNGGIAGCNSGIVQSCYFKGSLSVEQKNANENSVNVYCGGIAGEDNRDYGMGGRLKKCLNAGIISVSGGEAYAGQICGYVAANVNPISSYISNCYGKNNSKVPLMGWYGNRDQIQPELADSKVLTEEEWRSSSSFAGLDFDAEWKNGKDGPELMDSSDITSIQVMNAPSTCLVGEQLYYWGSLKINGTGTVQITDSMIAAFDNSRAGTAQVKIRYMGKSLSYNIQVTEPKEITGLTASGTLKKNTYAEGELFDPSGIILVLQSGGQYHYIKSGFTWNTEPLKPTDTAVTLFYSGKTVSVPVTVTGKAPSKLEINTEQNRSYAAGSVLDLSDVKVRITYNNGETSGWISASEFDNCGIQLAKASSGSNTYTETSRTASLNIADSGSTYCLYVGTILPGKTGTVCCKLGTITVRAALSIDGENLYFTVGKDCYGYLYLSGGSGSYQTVVKSEKLPQGINRTWLPNETSGAFGYEGVAEQQGEFVSTYQVTDTVTKEVKMVQITIHVQPSNKVQMVLFELKMAQNPGLKKDVAGKITETQVILEVPEETDITNLMPNIDYGAGSGADCNYWNGSRLNFTNPVMYILTAPDGITKRTYEVIVKKVKISDDGTGGDSGNNTDGNTGDNTGGTGTETGGGGSAGSSNGNNGQISGAGQGSGNAAGNGNTEVTGNGAAIPAIVKLNATSLPLQVKKSTTVLKIKEYSTGDAVASWSSSNKKVATVNARTGKITARKTGKTTITVTMQSGATAKCLIKVQKGKVKTKKLNVGKTAITLKKGEKYRITWEKQPLTSSEKVTFQSTKKKIAAVSGKGVITAKKKGTTYITVKSGSKKRKIKVTVK